MAKTISSHLRTSAIFLSLLVGCGSPPPCKPPPPPSIDATTSNQCADTPGPVSTAFQPPGVRAGDLNWPKVPHDAQLAEELAVYSAKVGFAAAFPSPTQQQLTELQAAITKENELDLAFIETVNGTLAAGKSDFSAAIQNIDAAVKELITFMSSKNVPSDRLSDAMSHNSDIHKLAVRNN